MHSMGIKKQKSISRFRTKAEYRAMSTVVVEATWVSFILRDLGVRLEETP